jgi:hypothetical protein
VFDIVDHGDAGFAIQIGDPVRKLGLLQYRLAAQTHNLDKPFEVIINWFEFGEGGKTNITNLCDKKDVALDEPFEKQFRLPVPNARIAEPMVLRFARMFGDKTTKISRLEVRGRLAPMFGLAWDQKQGVVFLKNVVPNGLAEKAGFHVGDVLLAINGKKPQTMQEAVEMLSRVSIGDEVMFSVQRADKTEELRVVAE